MTVLQTITLHDELTFNLSYEGALAIKCDDPTVPIDKTNLVLKAATAFQKACERRFGGEITLEKKIPSQAGLGGASSNAAVTLLAANQFCGSGSGKVDEALNVSRLGADVPFFLVGGRCAATGTGTTLEPLPDGLKKYLIVITPNAKISTAEAYAALKAGSLTTSESASILSSSLAELNSSDSRQWPLRNDFERVIFEIEPEIERAKMALLEEGARGALLAGSGSSVFGVFDSEAARDLALENLRCEAGWRVFSCETLSRDEYFRAMNSSGFPLFTLS